jgi:ABC-type multidrug transport system permease subunit
MKLWKIILKNFKVLFRSKSSAFVVLVGPLLIVGLIALALSNTGEFSINVGAVTTDMEGMTGQFIEQLEVNDYRVINFDTLEECIKQIKLRTTNLCIKFPPNFILDNEKTYKVEFHVDQSRLNVVETIKSAVLSTITVKSDEITLELTNKLIETINIANDEAANTANLLNELEVSSISANKNINNIGDKGKEAAKDVKSAEEDNNKVNPSIERLNAGATKLLADLDKLLDSAEGLETKPSKTTEVRSDEKNFSVILPAEVSVIEDSSAKLKNSLAALQTSISSGNGIQGAAEKVQADLKTITENIAGAKTSIQKIRSEIEGIKISSATSIVNPFTIEVNPISSTSNKGTLLFPYFLTLVILFVGIMLSSTLVMFEKKSRAFFRTFTTPTSELSHLLAGYITNFAVLAVQLLVVCIGAIYYLEVPLLDNLWVNIVVLIFSITFFVSLGTMVGYLFKTQEGTTIASISMGSLFLFLSNLILPVESFSRVTQKLLLLNPFMLCSELFKKSMLFGASFMDMRTELLLLIVYIIVVVVLAVIFQKLSFYRLFTGAANRKVLKIPHVTKENCLKMPDGTLLSNKKDLIHALKSMKEDVFNMYVTPKNNEIAVWVKDAFKSRKLAKRLRKAESQEEMIRVLELDTSPNEQIKEVHKKIVFQRTESTPKPKKKGFKIKFELRK